MSNGTDTDYPGDALVSRTLYEFTPRKLEYNIVTAFCEADLERLVTARMAAGWLPQGGVHVTLGRHETSEGILTVWLLHQAMTK